MLHELKAISHMFGEYLHNTFFDVWALQEYDVGWEMTQLRVWVLVQ